MAAEDNTKPAFATANDADTTSENCPAIRTSNVAVLTVKAVSQLGELVGVGLVVQVLSAQRTVVIEAFTGLCPAQFQRLVQAVRIKGGRALTPSQPGRPWALRLEDRVLLVAMYYRTNLTMRQLAPLFGISPAAVGRIIDRHSPLLALARARRKPKADEVVIVDGTLVPTRDRSVSAPSKKLPLLDEPTSAGACRHPSRTGRRPPVAG